MFRSLRRVLLALNETYLPAFYPPVNGLLIIFSQLNREIIENQPLMYCRNAFSVNVPTGPFENLRRR